MGLYDGRRQRWRDINRNSEIAHSREVQKMERMRFAFLRIQDIAEGGEDGGFPPGSDIAQSRLELIRTVADLALSGDAR